jgi:hypothetical protein
VQHFVPKAGCLDAAKMPDRGPELIRFPDRPFIELRIVLKINVEGRAEVPEEPGEI